MKKYVIFLSVSLILLACAKYNPVRAEGGGVVVSPQRVEIGLDFKGVELSVSGTAPDGSDIYVKMASPDDSVMDLAKKGKVGLFWLNVANVRVNDFPKLYQIVSSKPLDMLPEALRAELGLNQDFSYVFSRAKVVRRSENGPVQLSGEDAGEYIAALIDINKKKGLYTVRENIVDVEGAKFRARILLPPNVPKEKCSVTVYAVKDGKLVCTENATVDVGRAGVARWLHRKAIYDGPMYGFMAVMIAIAFGTGVSMIFSCIEKVMSGGQKTSFNPGTGH